MLKYIKHIVNIQYIDYYVFLVVLFALPFGGSLFSPLLFLWFLIVLISYFIKKDFILIKPKEPLFILIVFYLVYAISSLLTTALKVGMNELLFKLPLLLVPLLYPSQRDSYRIGLNNIMISFVLGCIVASLYYFGYAVYRSLSLVEGSWVFNSTPQKGWGSYFLITELSYLIHPSYLSLFLLVALLMIGLYFKKLWLKGVLFRFCILISILILTACLIMLQSRAGLLGFGLLTLGWLAYLILVKRKLVLGGFIFVSIFLTSIVLVYKIPRFTETFKSLQMTVKSGIANDKSKEDGTAVRIWIWKSAISAIKEHPIFGVGTYNVKGYLSKEYTKREMNSAISYKLNAHNQFLETWLGMGVFGLVSLLLMFIIPLRIGFKRKDWLLVGFIVLCGLSFMFESMLERTVGIVFFTIFYTILISVKTNLKISAL